MKNIFKLLGIVSFVATIGSSAAGCKLDEDYAMLNGEWDRGDIVVTFNGRYYFCMEILFLQKNDIFP
jgi:hypothetical protein